MHSPFFSEFNQLHADAQEAGDVREHHAVALIAHHVGMELRNYAMTGATRASLDITFSFKFLPMSYTYTPPRNITLRFPDLEKARRVLAKEVPEIVWGVIDEHATPGECACTYTCYRYGISAAWTWTHCGPDLT